MKLALKFDACPLEPFLPEAQREKISGTFQGTTAIEKAPEKQSTLKASGSLELLHAVIQHFAALEQAAAFTGYAELNPLRLDVAMGTYEWTPERLEMRDLILERKKVICVQGRGTLRGENLEATLQLGVAPEIVDKFPGAREEVFTRSDAGYLWTTVRLSGTISNPRNDLKERLLAALEHHFAKNLLTPITQPGKAAREAIGLLLP